VLDASLKSHSSDGRLSASDRTFNEKRIQDRERRVSVNPNARQPLSAVDGSGQKAIDPQDLAFRAEAMRTHSNSGPGKMTLAVPLPFAWYSGAALCLTCMIVAFLSFGTYTTTEKAEAVIVTEAGLFPITKDVEGTVEKIYVREGETVQAGTPLIGLRVEEGFESDGEADRPYPSDEPNGAQAVKTKVEDVESPVEGVVFQLPLRPGNSYKSYMNVAIIARSGRPVVTAFVSAKAKSELKVGDKVVLVLQGEDRGKAKLSGHVTSVAMSPNEQYARETRMTFRTYRVDIAVEADARAKKGDILLGETVEIRLPLQKRKMYQWLFDPLRKLFAID
jgi:HlyD family secretion protein